MLYTRQSQHMDLCVLRVSTRVLDLPGVIVTDSNASSDYARFAPAPQGLTIVNEEMTFAEYWTHPDPIENYRRKSAKCAEVLVPDRIDPKFITSAYVSCAEAEATFEATGINLPVIINAYLFFR